MNARLRSNFDEYAKSSAVCFVILIVRIVTGFLSAAKPLCFRIQSLTFIM